MQTVGDEKNSKNIHVIDILTALIAVHSHIKLNPFSISLKYNFLCEAFYLNILKMSLATTELESGKDLTLLR